MQLSEVSEALQAQVVSLERIKIEAGEAYQIYMNNLEQTAEKIISAAASKKFVNLDLRIQTLDSYTNKRVRMIATVKQDNPENITMKIEDESSEEVRKMISFHSFIFDLNGYDVPSCLMNDKSLIAQARLSLGVRIEVFGTVVMVPISRKKFVPMLFVDKIVPNVSLLKILNPGRAVKRKAERILKKTDSRLFEILVSKVCKVVGVVGVRRPGEAAKAVEFSVLVAASNAVIDGKNGRIHAVYHSAPGAGKQKSVYAARIVNPIFEEVTGGKVTVAGFASSFSRDPKTSKVISQKGYLAKADKGTLVIEDYHAMDENTRDRLMAILSPQMENGEFEDSTSARTRHKAATAIHIDGNFRSQVDKSRRFAPYEEISLPYNIITRFDIMMNIKPIEITENSIVEMVDSTMGEVSSIDDSAILFKTIIALLIDRIPDVDVSPVKALISERYKNFREDNADLLKSNSDLHSVFARTFKSIRKIVVAHARLHQRAVATQADVDYAMEVFAIKLKSLRMLIPGVKIDNVLSGKAAKTRLRQKVILREFSGKTVSLSKVNNFLNENGYRVGDRTLRRDLDGIGKNVGGKWLISSL